MTAVKPVDAAQVAEPRRPFPKWFRQTGWRHLVGIAMTIFAAFPLLYVLSASLNPGGTLVTANSLFSEVSIGSYIELFNRPQRRISRSAMCRSTMPMPR